MADTFSPYRNSEHSRSPPTSLHHHYHHHLFEAWSRWFSYCTLFRFYSRETDPQRTSPTLYLLNVAFSPFLQSEMCLKSGDHTVFMLNNVLINH